MSCARTLLCDAIKRRHGSRYIGHRTPSNACLPVSARCGRSSTACCGGGPNHAAAARMNEALQQLTVHNKIFINDTMRSFFRAKLTGARLATSVSPIQLFASAATEAYQNGSHCSVLCAGCRQASPGNVRLCMQRRNGPAATFPDRQVPSTAASCHTATDSSDTAAGGSPFFRHAPVRSSTPAGALRSGWPCSSLRHGLRPALQTSTPRR